MVDKIPEASTFRRKLAKTKTKTNKDNGKDKKKDKVPEASAFPRTLAASHRYRPVWVYSAYHISSVFNDMFSRIESRVGNPIGTGLCVLSNALQCFDI